MRVFAHDRFTFALPPGHRFPLAKYRLLREALEADGGFDVQAAEAVSWAALARVHDTGFLQRVRMGEMTLREQRALGLPWSPELVERARRTAGGTLAAARDALATGIGMNLGGGLHHAGRAAGRGFCLVNDMAIALAALRRSGELEPDARVLVVDCDVHRGDGTAELLAPDRAVLTLSLHAAQNMPLRRAVASDLDVALATGTADAAYLDALREALAVAGPRAALAFYLAGADPWEGDALGRLALTKDGLRERDAFVLRELCAAGTPVCVLLAGGYAPDVRDTVAINRATAHEARRYAARA